MFDTGKVIWKEGMFLQPQHFQQAERYLLDVLGSHAQTYVPHGYGFTGLTVDVDGLANGLFGVTLCTGILPDSTVVSMPQKDRIPAPRSFAEQFGHDVQSLDVYVGVPVAVEGRTNVSAGAAQLGGISPRYRSRTVSVADEVVGAQRKEIEVGAPNFAYLFGGESLDTHSSLPVARLVRNARGQVTLDETFVPPLLYIGASEHVLGLLRGMLEVLLAKIAALSQGRRQTAGGLAQFSGGEETAFRLLQTLNTYTPLINHHHIAPAVHPYDLFCALTQLAGALCTFSGSVSIKNLPRYDHRNLSAVFERFSVVVREVLGADIQAGSATLPVRQVGPATFAVEGADQKTLASSKCYLAVSANVPEKELIVGVVQRMKVCSRARLDVLISSAMPGVRLMHTARAPENLSTKPGFQYFQLDQQGDLWRDIVETGSLAVYFPNNYQNLAIEVVILRQ